MRIERKEYSEEFTKSCRVEFGLEPAQIKKIIALLSVNQALDVEAYLKQVDELKSAMRGNSVLINHLTDEVKQLSGF